jgi:hyperosmotically inducible protein
MTMRLRLLVVPLLGVSLSAIQPAVPAQAAKPQPGVTGSDDASDATATRRGQFAARLNDLWITAMAKARLLRNEEVPGLDVDVDSRDGVVTLFGMVPTPSAQAAAELEVVKTKGVHRVENRLEVVPEPQQEATRAHDRALEDVLRERLEERPELTRPDLDVAVCNGVARLRGRVENEDAHRVALETVRDTDGVREVLDQIEIETGGASAPAASS